MRSPRHDRVGMASNEGGQRPFEDTTTPMVRAPRTRPLGVAVRVIGASAKPTRLVLGSGGAIVGSSPDADLSIQETTVSRQHCRLELTAEGIAVTDLGSRNGTWFLGQRIEGMVLAPGSAIAVGSATLVLGADVEDLQREPGLDVDTYNGILGRSPGMRRLFGVIERMRSVLVPVLITGESGVGKELVARALHVTSSVARGPFVVVNCGALARELVASELFGHRRGAFTGAVESRRGAFDAADGGTLFLDEIGELPLDLQPALLRALEAGEVQPVGDSDTHKVRVRIVSATNRKLENEIGEGRFREDLYYRLATVPLHVPPLRERREDIEQLAAHFASSSGLTNLDPSVLAQLHQRTFPGNVRELKNAIAAFAALGSLPEPPRISGKSLDDALLGTVDITRPYAEQKEEVAERFTRAYLKQLLDHTGGNQTIAARLAGLDRGYLGRLVAKFDLKR
jgi:transcriptional regulator with GAF, ATPase, and Fis domain